MAFENYKSNLIPCDVCGRTFTEKALAHHRNACQPGGHFDDGKRARPVSPQRPSTASPTSTERKSGGGFSPSMAPSSPNSSAASPVSKMVLCPYCGREYGSKSLPIHIKTCQTKHHDVKVSEEVVQKVLAGQMNKAEVILFSQLNTAYNINERKAQWATTHSTMRLHLMRPHRA